MPTSSRTNAAPKTGRIPTIQGFLATLSRPAGSGFLPYALAGYEDAFYWLWKERRLPVNVDPHESNLSDPEERERIARVFDQGPGQRGGVRAAIAHP
jgi:uncharacterized protein (DUF2126 family)